AQRPARRAIALLALLPLLALVAAVAFGRAALGRHEAAEELVEGIVLGEAGNLLARAHARLRADVHHRRADALDEIGEIGKDLRAGAGRARRRSLAGGLEAEAKGEERAEDAGLESFHREILSAKGRRRAGSREDGYG